MSRELTSYKIALVRIDHGGVDHIRIDLVCTHQRKVEAKKRRVENCDRLAAASSLLALSEDGNSSAYCEPHTGMHTLTALTMADVDKLERENDHLKSENMQLRKECEWLKDENERLVKETMY